MNKMMKAAMALVIVLGLAVRAEAWKNPDSLVVTIAPDVYYAVLISTDDVGLDLGSVALEASTQTVKPSTVTIESSYGETELELQGGIVHSASLQEWSFDADSANVETDKLAAWAVFTTTDVLTAPSQTGGYFNGTSSSTLSDLFNDTSIDVGTLVDVEDRFCAEGMTGYTDMETIPPYSVDEAGSRSHLFLMFRLPGASTSPGDQYITVTLTAVAPN